MAIIDCVSFLRFSFFAGTTADARHPKCRQGAAQETNVLCRLGIRSGPSDVLAAVDVDLGAVEIQRPYLSTC
jgi:hypothetical protein